MKEMDLEKIDDVISYLHDCAIIASRSNRSSDLTLYLNIIAWLNELRFRREKTNHTEECALEVVREELNNGGPFKYEEWRRCTHCRFKHALFIPRNFCPNCGYKFTKTIYKGDGVLFGNKEDEDEQKIEGDARADSTCKGD